MRASVRLALLTLTPAILRAQGPAYLAYADGEGGRPFRGYYLRGHLVSSPQLDWDSVFAVFKPGQFVTGISATGARIRVRIDSVNREAEYYESVLLTSVSGRSIPSFLLLTGRPSLSLKLISYRRSELTEVEDSALRRQATVLWHQALRERAPDDRMAQYSFRRPEVHTVQSVPDVITVLYPVDITWSGQYADDRASFFFIYSRSAHRIVYGAFGHPEWAPSDNSIVLTVKPIFYFQVGADPSVYFVGEHSGGWESSGMAVYDLRTGRVVLDEY